MVPGLASGDDRIPDDDNTSLLKVQRDSLKRALERYSKWGVKPTAVGIFLLGTVVMITWALTRDESNISMLLLLLGPSLITIAFMFYFLSPSRYLRSDVCDAVAIANTENLSRILSSLLVNSKGVYLPPRQTGVMKLFIPVLVGDNVDDLGEITIGDNQIFSISGRVVKGIIIDPPGQGLYRYSRKIGAFFTSEGLEYEIKDLLENGLELASGVRVTVGDNEILVSMSRIANTGMCSDLRKGNPAICEQLGCPICSFLGCIIADGTGRKVRAKSISVYGHKIEAVFELLGD